jgi:nucleoside-diphosphate-sugar epimerase
MTNIEKTNNPLVLVTGGAGYIGTHVVEQLIEKNYRVRIFDSFIFGTEPMKDLIIHQGVEVIKGDIGELSKLIPAFEGVDHVVHLAGLVGDPACSINRDLTIKNNIMTANTVKELSKHNKVKKFIFASSCSVYGSSEEKVDENSALNPVSLYAQTKIDSEKEILSDMSEDLHPVVLRFATVFGHSRRPRFDLVTNFFTAQAHNDSLITVKGSNQWRPFVYVGDLARAIVNVIEAPLSKVDRQIFNAGDDDLNLTIGDLAKLVKKVIKNDKNGKEVSLAIDDDSTDKRNYFVSFDKIKTVLGFRSKTNLEEGIKEIHQAFINNLYKGSYKDKMYSNAEMTKLLNESITNGKIEGGNF